MNTRPPRIGKKIKPINTLLVDGNSLFKRGLLGTKSEYNILGEHIGGIYYFITTLRNLLEENLYHQVYVFWDREFSGRLRWEIYKDYKSGRGKDYINGSEPKDPNEIFQQQSIKQYLEELFIRQVEDEVVEADDFIAFYCKTIEPNETVTIVSSDRDLCQLVNDKVSIYIPDLKEYITPKNYKKWFGYHHENAALLKIICGDNPDTIKGIKGIGEKTLMEHFPYLKQRKSELHEILRDAESIQVLRESTNKKRLKSLDNIINCVTDGIQGSALYEINNMLVNLQTPLLTEEAMDRLGDIRGVPLNPDDRGIKNAYEMMKKDGMAHKIKNYSIEYLLPFKRLINREISLL